MSAGGAREFLDRAYRERDPRQRLTLLSDAVAIAVEQDSRALELEARIATTSVASLDVSDIELALTSFGASLAIYDSDRQRFQEHRDTLLWQYKWMPSRLAESPEFPLEQIRAVLDDMEEHYRAEGMPLAGVYSARFSVARMTGNDEDAAHWLSLLRSVPRDLFSDCEACEFSAVADHAAETGRDAEVLRALDDVMARNLRCTSEPAGISALSLAALRRSGRDHDADQAFTLALRAARHDQSLLFVIPALIAHCTAVGNLDHGLTLVERHGPWLRADRLAGETHLRFLTAAGALLTRVVASGYGDAIVRPDLEPYLPRSDAGRPAADLAVDLERVARDLAARFDARNGNSTQRDRVDAAFEAAARVDDEQQHTLLRSAPPASIPRPAPRSVAEWLDRALTLEGLGCPREAAEAARHGLAADPDPMDRASLLRVIVQGARATNDVERVRSASGDRVEALLAAGLPDEAEVEHLVREVEDLGHGTEQANAALHVAIPTAPTPTTRARLTASLAAGLMASDPGRAISLFREAADATAGDQSPLVRARHTSIRRGLAQALFVTGRAPEAEELLVQVGVDAQSRGEKAAIELQRASVLATLGRTEEALGALEIAVREGERLDVPRALVGPLLFVARLHLIAGSPEHALAATTRARALAARTEGLVPPTALHAQALRMLGRADDGLDELLADLDRLPHDAAPSDRAELHESLGNLLLAVGDRRQARDAFVAAADEHDQAGDPDGRLRTLLPAAELDAFSGDAERGIAELREVARLADEADQRSISVRARRVLVDTLGAHGREDDAMDVLAEAVAIEGAEPWERAMLDLIHARLLERADRGEAALAPAVAALERFDELGDDAAAADAEFTIAAIENGLGRTEETVRRLRSALGRSQNRPGFIVEASLRLAAALELLGRHDEARDVRAAAETGY